jgi:hypothetical protein
MPPNRGQEDTAGAWVPPGSPAKSGELESAAAEDWLVPERDDLPARGGDARADEVSWNVQAGAPPDATDRSTPDELRRRRQAVAERVRQSSAWPRELAGPVRDLEARIDRVLEAREGSGSGRS